MNKPLNTYRHKGIQVNDWGSGKFSIDKRYKKKDSDEWISTKSYFREELVELEKLIHEALSKPISEQPEVPQEIQPQQFDDDSIPF